MCSRSAHRSAGRGILPPACQAEVGAAAAAPDAPAGPGVLEAGGCSEPQRWGEASELGEEVDLSGREAAGMEGAAAGAAWGLGTGRREWRSEEDREEEKIQAETKEELLWGGRSPGQQQEEEDQT